MSEDDDSTVPAKSRRASTRIFPHGALLNGTYEILGVLGEGGMGQVFDALDRSLNRRVAIKATWPNRDPRWLRMEAAALAALRHPTMVAVHHLSSHDGVEYVVMERIYGVSLATHLQRRRAANGRFSVSEVLDVLIGVADGLATVHRAGLAHRDVKPANVLLAPGNRVVLMDFGLAQPEADRVEGGGPAGTPAYMAPEAIMADMRAGERFLVDLYALGVMAYEMLTLQPAFSGRTTVDVWSAHLGNRPPDPRERRDDVPPQLAELVLSLMAKSPSDRPRSIDTIVLALRAMRGHRAAPAAEGAISVLIVDDDAEMTALLRAIVRKIAPGVAIATAHDAALAIKHVHKQPPDLMLLDLRMPSMNGIELAMYLRGTHLADATTIVAVSALAKDDDLALLQALGITQFVPKGPDLAAQLQPIVRDVEQRRSAR